MSYEPFYSQHVQKIKIRGQFQATGLCPLHEDNNSSFSVNLATGQWYCFAGCGSGNHITFARRLQVSPPENLPAQALRHDTGRPSVASGGGGHPSQAPKRLIAEYIYQDEFKNNLFKVLRFEPKSFAQMRWAGDMWVSGNMGDVARVPYRLPQILVNQERPVYWVEGEKDVHTLEGIGLVASTSPMGAASWKTDYARWLEGRKVVVLPDNDPQGEAYARRVADDLANAHCVVKLVRLPGLAPKQDVSDYLLMPGNSRETLLDLVRNSPEHRALHNPDQPPLEYFAGRNLKIEPQPDIPTGWQSLCKRGYNTVAANVGELGQAGFERIKEVDEAWLKVEDHDSYQKFLKALMALHQSCS